MNEDAKLFLRTVAFSFLATLGACGGRYDIGDISQGGSDAGGRVGTVAGSGQTQSAPGQTQSDSGAPIPQEDGSGTGGVSGAPGPGPSSNGAAPNVATGGAPFDGGSSSATAGRSSGGYGGVAPNVTPSTVDAATCAAFPVDGSMLHYGTPASPDVVINRLSLLLDDGQPLLLSDGTPFSIRTTDVVTPDWADVSAASVMDFAQRSMQSLPGITRFMKSWLGAGDAADGKAATQAGTDAFIQDSNFTSLIAPDAGGGLLVDPGLARLNQTIDTRGAALLLTMFCSSVGPQPFGTNPSGVLAVPGHTRRDALGIATMESPSCLGCHALLDPLGASQEILDPTTGAGRSTDEYGNPIDASGTFSTGRFPYSQEYSFTSIDDLAPQLASSCEVLRCFVESYVQDATTTLGLPALPADELEFVVQSFTASGYSLRALVRAFVQTPTFLQ